MKSISRREFLKGASALGLSTTIGTALGMTASAESTTEGGAIYTPGTYTGTAHGMESDVTVTITVDETSILSAVVEADGETKEIGQAAAPTLADQLLAAQSQNIDGVSGATRTSDAVRKAAEAAIAEAKGVDVSLLSSNDEEANATSSDWLGAEPEVADSEIAETIDCDVLVIGAGHAGSFAAAAAAEAGAKTILIEKFGHDMASGIRDTLAAVGSAQQKEDGFDVDPEEAKRYIRDWSQGYARPQLVQAFVDNSGEMTDWYTAVLKRGGMDYRHEIDETDLPANYKGLEVGHSVQYGEEYYEQLTMDKVLDYAMSRGLEVHYETTMVKLVKEGDAVVGIIATKADGSYVRYNAKGGVIVATGGYSANDEMMNILQPWSVEQTCINYSKSGSKGDGIKACLWAGAAMDSTHTSMIFDRGAIKPDKVGKTDDGQLFWMGSQPFLKVNLNGERFMNEYQPYDYVLHTASTQPYHTYATIWDNSWVEDTTYFKTHGCSRLYPHANGAQPVFPIEYIQGMNAELEENGYIVKADTLEELAEKLGLPAEKLVATVDRYNELVDAGEDKDFGKEAFRLTRVDEAPFYGVRQAGGYLICTMDGIRISENMLAMTEGGEEIQGLYVCGDCSGNYFSGSYPNLMAGAAAGRSATFGRMAGKFAAKTAGFENAFDIDAIGNETASEAATEGMTE